MATIKPCFISPHHEHRSSVLRPKNFAQTSKFFSFYLELHVLHGYQNKLQNLIRTSKFKFSFRGLLSQTRISCFIGYFEIQIVHLLQQYSLWCPY